MGRYCVSVALVALVMSSAARVDADPIEGYLAGDLIAPTASNYRNAAQELGYDRGHTKVNFGAELGALFAVAFGNRLAIGPLLRFDIGRMGAPYDGVEPIRTDAAFLALREELTLFHWPRLIAWVDEGVGIGRIGTSGGHNLPAAWSVRFGVGIRIGNQKPAIRLRFGYAIAPTFSSVTSMGGKYDFGGFIFAIDGVLRVAD